MTIHLYFWSPWRQVRHLMTEMRHHSEAWAYLFARTGRSLSNFGDQLSPQLVSSLTGERVRWARPAYADMVAVGSVLEPFLLPRQHSGSVRVWGTGLRSPRVDIRSLTDTALDLRAVRGHLTRAALHLPASTPVGDPGLLASELITPRATNRRSGIAIVPHFSDVNRRAPRAWLRQQAKHGAQIALPSESTRCVLGKIASADYVLTSGLHGLVLADALGKPSTLLRIDPSRVEPWDKFADYASVFDLDVSVVAVEQLERSSECSWVRQAAEQRAAKVAERLPAVQERLSKALL